MLKILVLCSGYPSEDNPYNCTWAHLRNKQYIKEGLLVEVLNFSASKQYVYEKVKVVLKEDAVEGIKSSKYDVIISHSPNLRNHLPILNMTKIVPVVLFMHGSESMYIDKDYPEPYDFMKDNNFKRMIRRVYDELKFKFLKSFLLRNVERVSLIFVSEWMKNIFKKNVLDPDALMIKNYIINNSLGEWALDLKYSLNDVPAADFITLRRLDYSKFAIDLVVEHALSHPELSYHVFGKGRYFDYYPKPDNVTIFDYHVHNNDIPMLLNKYRCALMPTRCDAQGVMVCEIATYGMPIISTAIDVNFEMLDSFDNVNLVPIENFASGVQPRFNNGSNKLRFSLSNTIKKEIEVLNSIGK